ncbi:glycosyltransferase family 2 protein [Chloroflexota bacterium]
MLVWPIKPLDKINMGEEVMKPLVSVIILTFNGREYIGDCLASVLQQSYPNFEVIVVDNASQDYSADIVEQQFPSVTLIRSHTNVGFPAGNNIGIRASHGEYVILLNQDTTVTPLWMEELVKVTEQDEQIGICGSKLLSLHEPQILDRTAQLVSPDLIVLGRGRGETDAAQFEKVEEIFGPSAAAALYRRRMLDEIGLMDESYFLCCDDVELNLKARLAGWKCFYAPKAVAYHAHSVSTGEYSPLKLYYGERNRIWNVVTFLPVSMVISSFFFSLHRYLSMVFFALNNKGKKAQAVKKHSLMKLGFTLIKAWASACWGLPRMMKKRGRIQRKKRVSNRDIKNWLKQYAATLKEVVEI